MTSERYECKLSADMLDKACLELNEPRDNQKRLEAIDSLREAFKSKYPDTKLVREDDAFLLRFLRVRKFDEDGAIQTLLNYHTNIAAWPEVFDKVRNPKLIEDNLNRGVVLPIKGRAKDGSKVVIGRPGIGEKQDILELYAAIFLSIEKMIEEEETQVCGVTVIQDLAYYGMEYVKQTGPSTQKKFVGIVQDSLPVRTKSMNITNAPKFFEVVWKIAQPFIKDKMKERFSLLGTDFDPLYKKVDKAVLPPMFAGYGPELDPEEWKFELMGEDTAL